MNKPYMNKLLTIVMSGWLLSGAMTTWADNSGRVMPCDPAASGYGNRTGTTLPPCYFSNGTQGTRGTQGTVRTPGGDAPNISDSWQLPSVRPTGPTTGPAPTGPGMGLGAPGSPIRYP